MIKKINEKLLPGPLNICCGLKINQRNGLFNFTAHVISRSFSQVVFSGYPPSD